MHEKERHRVILSAVQSHPVVTTSELCSLTGASEATVRRDIATLHLAKQLRRVRGGAESLRPTSFPDLAGRPFCVNQSRKIEQKQAIARAAVELCQDGESIIINGGTTTFQMVHALANRHCEVLTNSFAIAEHLVNHSKNSVLITGGVIYRKQNIVLSPFDNDVTRHFCADWLFLGAQGVGTLGVMEKDPLIVQAELKFLSQTNRVALLVDSSKFNARSSLVLCPLERVDVLITDEGINDKTAAMLEAAGIELMIAPSQKVKKSRTDS